MKLIRRIIDVINRSFKSLAKVYSLTFDDKLSQSYYPSQPQKSKLCIFIENLFWLIRFEEVNAFYYSYGFDIKNKVDQSNYMPASVFFIKQRKANTAVKIAGERMDYRCLLKDKFLFGRHVTAWGFPTPEIYALCDNKKVSYSQSHEQADLQSLLERDGLDAFCKNPLGKFGEEVFSLKVKDQKLLIDDKPANIEEFRSRISDRMIIQQRIIQHPQMAQLHPQSVNTIRLVTASFNYKIQALFAVIRIGAHGKCKDNWASGGLIGKIDMKQGCITGECFFKPGYGGKVTHHPDTNVKFDGFRIPFFEVALEMACSLHRFFYGLHSIGWDIAVTENGPVFIEANDGWEISLHQTVQGGLKKEFLETLK